jgi:hypothetical protein
MTYFDNYVVIFKLDVLCPIVQLGTLEFVLSSFLLIQNVDL